MATDVEITNDAWHSQRINTRHQVVTGNGTAYLFYPYHGPNPTPAWSKTTDGGSTWSAQVVVPGGVTGNIMDVYYARWSDSSLPNEVLVAWGKKDAVYFAVFNLTSETWTTSATVAVAMNATTDALVCSVSACISRSGDYWVTGHGLGNTTSVTARSTNLGSSWSNNAAAGRFPEGWRDEIMMWPDFSSADDDDILAIFCDNSAAQYSVKQLDVSAVSITETAIASAKPIGDGGTNPVPWSATLNSSGVVYLALMDTWNTALSTTTTINTYTINGATVTAKTAVIADDYTEAPYLSIDANGIVRCFYARDPEGTFRESQNLYYKTSSDNMATWGSETQISNLNSASRYWIITGIGDPLPKGMVLPIWFDYLDTIMTIDTPIEITTALTANIATTFTLTGTLSGATSASPPIVIKCKPIAVEQVINFSVGALR